MTSLRHEKTHSFSSEDDLANLNAELTKVSEDYPSLCADGGRPLRPDRQLLLPDITQVATCLLFLNYIPVPSSRQRRPDNSYHWKHSVEHWVSSFGQYKYVSNGAFVAAAIIKGIPLRWKTDSLNPGVCLAPSWKGPLHTFKAAPSLLGWHGTGPSDLWIWVDPALACRWRRIS